MRAVRCALIALTIALPVSAQTPAQLDSMRVELVRCVAFGKGADTQATKALNELAAGDTAAARVEMVRSRGMVRALITQCQKPLAILDRWIGAPPDTVIPDPPVEPEPEPEPEPPVWATGRWSLTADGQPLALDFDEARLGLPAGMGVVAVTADVTADTAHLTFSTPYGAGVMRLVHASDRVTGSMTVAGQSAAVTGERAIVQPEPDVPVPPVEPSPSDGRAFFADDFESYSIGSTIEGKGGNGFRWGGGNGYQPRISTEVAHSGTRSLKFPYGPTEPSGASHWWSEQRFTLGQQVKELWIEFWIYHPRGGEPLDPSDEWNRLSGSTMNRFCHPYRNPSNNKYMRLWGGADGYDKEGTWGFSANGTGNCDSSMGHEYAHYGHGVTPGYYSSPRVSLANDANRGRWVHMRFYNKMASGPNRADGVARVWMDGRLVIDRRDANSYSDRFPYTDRGYLMGYDNARFDQTTFIYIDDVKFYSSDPGW